MICLRILAEAIKYNKTLIALDLNMCNIRDAHLICLGEAIKTNTTLEALILLMNPFSSPALEKFVKTLANSRSGLQCLGVDLPKHQHLLYEDKDKQHRFLLAPSLQYWENKMSEYADVLINFVLLPRDQRTRQTS